MTLSTNHGGTGAHEPHAPVVTSPDRRRLNRRSGEAGRRLAPADAWYIFAKGLSTDQLLVYAFDGIPDSVEHAVEEVLARARSCEELRLRVRLRPATVGFPCWVAGEVTHEQVVVHNGAELDWSHCLTAAGGIIEDHQLDPHRTMWRLHVFVGVHGVPGSTGGPSTVAIAQISHALADGIRAAALAGFLFGRTSGLQQVQPLHVRWSVSRTMQAIRLRHRLIEDTEQGEVPAAAAPVPALSTNLSAPGPPILHTLVRHRSQLAGPSVTVAALVAISEALSGNLREHGEDPSQLAALVPMAYPGMARAHNHSGPEFIGLHPHLGRAERAELIATEFADRRRRHHHPAFAAERAALESMPGPLLRWVGSRPKPLAVLGNTAVSSVNRGPADVHFGGCPVFLSAGYPFLTPVIGLAHGVHGLGDRVAISINTTESAIADVAGYLDRLNAALGP
ncbi:DUF1298 domain-containing protein [Mycolicibacterium anyangense]|uniref:DUF1298 domain-containing protein n=1 Tax=Mycolicibacterium anyangense TaxID=1431246 RepID=A0A6N4W5J0_9MYCO|nr:DUF1298 domain-containing protein [Mycolicibacterium anyangense]BBZ75312.1 DUF1298 domain-containing protein [Mycolicibacterium anyangense]